MAEAGPFPVRGPAGEPLPALTRARIRQAAYLVGLAAGAHALAIRRAGERQQFGRPIAAFQAAGFQLAADAVHIEAARLLTWHAAGLADAGPAAETGAWPPADGDQHLAGAQALAQAADVATGVVRRSLHLHGTFGLTGAAPIQRYYRCVAVEAGRWGTPAALWREAGRRRLRPRTPITDQATAALAVAGKGER
jgi:alkylation response protein AidB-like acyl-CoA dehydrogenase